jgi:hypothetical protein
MPSRTSGRKSGPIIKITLELTSTGRNSRQFKARFISSFYHSTASTRTPHPETMSTSTNGKLKDGRQLDRIDAYAKHWQKDLKTDTKVRSRHSFVVVCLG